MASGRHSWRVLFYLLALATFRLMQDARTWTLLRLPTRQADQWAALQNDAKRWRNGTSRSRRRRSGRLNCSGFPEWRCGRTPFAVSSADSFWRNGSCAINNTWTSFTADIEPIPSVPARSRRCEIQPSDSGIEVFHHGRLTLFCLLIGKQPDARPRRRSVVESHAARRRQRAKHSPGPVNCTQSSASDSQPVLQLAISRLPPGEDGGIYL